MAAGVFSQAALARARAWDAAHAWAAGAVVFVALELALPGSPFHRVSLAFAAASLARRAPVDANPLEVGAMTT